MEMLRIFMMAGWLKLRRFVFEILGSDVGYAGVKSRRRRCRSHLYAGRSEPAGL